MWGDIVERTCLNLAWAFWFVVGFKVTAQIVFWTSGFMIEP